MTKIALKAALIDELADKLRGELASMERAQRAAIEGATGEEAKPENDKDTRALEQSYLARGQARRVEDLREGLARVLAMKPREFAQGSSIAVGALVTIEESNGTSTMFIAPHGGGIRLSGEQQVVTPSSPLGRALLGKTEGDECEVKLAERTRVFSIVEVT